MGEFWSFSDVPAVFLGVAEYEIPSDATQGDEHSGRELLHRFVVPGTAIGDFGGGGFVRRRRTMARAGDGTSLQLKPVVEIGTLGLVSPAGFVQRSVKPFTAAVSCEHAARSISPMCAGGKSHDQQLGSMITKIRDRLAPIILVLIRLSLFFGDGRAVLEQSRAAVALDDLIIKCAPLPLHLTT